MTCSTPIFRRWLRGGALASTLGLAVVGRSQNALVANSPFAPSAASAAASGATAAQDFELAGSTAEGKSVTVCIYVRQTHRSQWIPVGGVSDGIKVISFDAEHDKAVVVVGGVTKDISMRKATYTGKGVGAAGGPVFTPPAHRAELSEAAPPPNVAVTPTDASAAKPEAQQREARMLVSDLLEIGVQQRKAYQEAHQKASTGNPPAPNN